MATRTDVVLAAREWLGTPFRHQGRDARGIDCAGLVFGVAHGLGLTEFDRTDYARIPSGHMMEQTLAEHMDPTREPQPGDVVLMAFDGDPQHLAIMTEYGIIHVHERVGRCVEHRLDEKWRGRIVSAWAFRGIE